MLSRNIDTLQNNQDIAVYTEPVIKEDRHTLYGFIEKIDHFWFIELNKISGVGARFSLSILDNIPGENLYDTLYNKDEKTLTLANGVGKKLAQRIIMDLGAKITNKTFYTRIPNIGDVSPSKSSDFMVKSEANQALLGMGFDDHKIKIALDSTYEDNISLEDLIVKSLQILNTES